MYISLYHLYVRSPSCGVSLARVPSSAGVIQTSGPLSFSTFRYPSIYLSISICQSTPIYLPSTYLCLCPGGGRAQWWSGRRRRRRRPAGGPRQLRLSRPYIVLGHINIHKVARFIYINIYLSIYLFIYLSINLSIYLSICISIFISICLFVCFLSFYICVSVNLSSYISNLLEHTA